MFEDLKDLKDLEDWAWAQLLNLQDLQAREDLGDDEVWAWA